MLSHLIRKEFPIFVSTNNPYSLENIVLWLSLYKPSFKLLENNKYQGNKKKLKLYHVLCREEFFITWADVLAGNDCGICFGQQVGRYNNLAYKFPEIAMEWHPTKNEKLTPSNITYGSKKKVWWLCPNGHEYFVSVNTRTNNGSGCKQCADEQQESTIATGVKEWCQREFKYFCQQEYPIPQRSPKNGVLKFDVYIGEKNSFGGIYIEINGHQHYQKCTWDYQQAKRNNTTPQEEFEYRKKLDSIKRKFAGKNGKYIEVDLRKIKTTKHAIEYIERIIYGNN